MNYQKRYFIAGVDPEYYYEEGSYRWFRDL